MKNHMEMSFKAIIKNVTFARAVVASFLLDVDLMLNEINEIKTVVSEAVTNAIVHGYNENPSKNVKLILDIDNNELTMTIIDEGIGIANIEQAKMPLFSTKLSEERAGLGFTIMDIFSDYLEVNSSVGKGTEIICKKKLTPID